MNRILSLAALLCLSLLFSCSSDTDMPPPPPPLENPSSSSVQEWTYCVYLSDGLCLPGANSCPGGGVPSETCPFPTPSSNSVVPSSSSVAPSSSSVAQSSNSVAPSSSSVAQSSNSVAPSSSSIGNTAVASSSSVSGQSSSSVASEPGYCVFDVERTCLPTQTVCPSSAPFSKTCPYSSSSSFVILVSSSSVAIIPSSSSLQPSSSSATANSSSSLKECSVIFNPANKFCYDGDVYDTCDGMAYDPTIYICTGSVASLAKCNGVSYNPLTQICKGDGIITIKFCDYGYPITNDEKGCFPIEKISNCYTIGNASGILATSCGRTDLIYCDWGKYHEATSPSECGGNTYCGGCFVADSAAKCLQDKGNVVAKCPSTSL
jgi:hypothetical protein